MPNWTVKDIPPQTGRIAVVTGATSGIGYETAQALAGAGAKVIIASRNERKGAEVLAKIRAKTPGADVAFEPLDLASLDSVARTAKRITASVPRIDLLINNAGVMAIPDRHETEDGFEMQMGANYIGHFALNMRLLPKVLAAANPRVVTVSSLAHRSGKINFDDLQSKKSYSSWGAYCQSKLATLMFGLELDRIARAEGWNLMSMAAHPGYAVTGLQSAGPRMGRNRPGFLERFSTLIAPVMAQSATAGALPTLLAATSSEAEGGVMYGPNGFYELKGPPVRAKIVPYAQNKAVWRRLWEVSEQLTGLRMPLPVMA
ncbi:MULTISPECIES: SDR family oxidoreductase [Rhizobium]|uniref:NAD(P)-dependent dehydrogenase (Short-subunit alcohol dehydrogenase family) n=1 Tax=Rhizobium paranaense TaxID=1650438 RepID=A0A7W8XTL0_9HYPH|nr:MULTISPECIES: SDR family oxidoreductase [Rhizobium]MBB5575109.1 NAD(P)-dependent dehydrogenase (short-subunit alcohol dehydrogenase family) [Rhizobium paranaense]PST64459.1 short chain dehydrogenase [Rhizobium sp. SEMIA4064]